MPTTPRPRRSRALFAAAGIATGLTLGTAGLAAAATNSSTSSSSTSSTGSSTTAPSSSTPSGSRPATPPKGAAPSGQDPAAMAHGPGETLLTGDTAAKVKAAALAAVPGATVVRVETDSSGASTYEAHLKKADGSYVTVEVNSSFTVTGTESGFGGGPQH